MADFYPLCSPNVIIFHFNLFATMDLSLLVILHLQFRFHLEQAGRTGPISSNDAASGLGNASSGGSSARGPPSSAAGNELSPEAYCRKHEITVSVSIYET
jgi:hypothetical protein